MTEVATLVGGLGRAVAHHRTERAARGASSQRGTTGAEDVVLLQEAHGVFSRVGVQ
jgi:hypothetical protein